MSSLQVRLTDFIAALGADVKYLLNRNQWNGTVWTFGPPPSFKTGILLAYFATSVPGYISVYNSSSAVGDFATWRGDIWPGTWTFRSFYIKQSNMGIVSIDYSLNEGATWTPIVANMDMYSAAVTAYQFTDKTGVVVTKAQPTILIRWSVSGKNASSTGNIFVAGPTALIRTA